MKCRTVYKAKLVVERMESLQQEGEEGNSDDIMHPVFAC
jgi:hypothetical protein